MKSKIQNLEHCRSQIPGGMLVSLAIGSALIASPTTSLANDVIAPAAICHATFLDQAMPMRWHEHYVMNPSTNVSTWVICPVTYDNDIVLAVDRFNVAVVGSYMSGASSTLPTCFVTVYSLFNTSQDPYRTGNELKYTRYLPITRSGPDVWVAEAPLYYTDIASVVGTDPNLWVSNAYCELPSGYSISGIVGSDDI